MEEEDWQRLLDIVDDEWLTDSLPNDGPTPASHTRSVLTRCFGKGPEKNTPALTEISIPPDHDVPSEDEGESAIPRHTSPLGAHTRSAHDEAYVDAVDDANDVTRWRASQSGASWGCSNSETHSWSLPCSGTGQSMELDWFSTTTGASIGTPPQTLLCTSGVLRVTLPAITTDLAATLKSSKQP
eukprot:SAG11_NODE_340_length_10476_cov_6.009155_14_plen_184_part_00